METRVPASRSAPASSLSPIRPGQSNTMLATNRKHGSDSPTPWRERPAVTLCAVSAIHVLAAFGMFMIPTLAANIKETTGLGSAEIGFNFSLAFAMGGVAAVSVGGFTRRYGPGRVFQAGQLVLALGALLFGSAAAPLIPLGAAMVGFGFGVASPTTSIIVAQFSRAANFNLLLSVKQMATPMGAALAGATGPAMADALGWPGVFACIAVLALGSLVALAWFRRTWDRETQPSAPISPPWNGFRLIFRDRTLAVLGLTGFLYSVAQLGLTGFVVLFLVEDMSYSAISAGLMLSLVNGIGLLSRPFWGWCADALGTVFPVLTLLGVTTAACAALIALMAPDWPDWLVYAVFLLFGASGFGWSGVQVAAVASVVPSDRRAESFSGTFGLIFLGSWAGPGIASFVFSVFHGYTAVFVFLGLAGLAGAALTGYAWSARR